MVCGTDERTEQFLELDTFLENLPSRDGALIPLLHKAQLLYGYLSDEVQLHIAQQLEIPVSKVYGVVTFYSFFSTKKRGQYKINICMGTACFVRGAEAVIKEFEKELSISISETTQDGVFTLDNIRCVGACGLAPVVMVNDKVYGRVKPDEVKGIVDECLKGAI